MRPSTSDQSPLSEGARGSETFSGEAGAGGRALPLIPDRNVHLLRSYFTDQLRHAPGERRVDLDLEVIHRLHRLVVFLAEGHLALRRLEAHALHRADQLVGGGI